MIDAPDQSGRIAVVTGANSGLGFHASVALAAAGAHVVMACRNPAKSEDARQRLLAAVPDASVELQGLDLADLSSVQEAAGQIAANHEGIDILLNNAGIMAVPRGRTVDGFELQFGTNHLGHFAFTGHLLPSLLQRPGARVVTVSSFMHYIGRIYWNDLNFERIYERWLAYGQSKLANLLFAVELNRRFEAGGVGAISVAAHPGYARTGLQHHSGSKILDRMMRMGERIPLATQSAESGAAPLVYAATAPNVVGGGYYGPRYETVGGDRPRKTIAMPWARDKESAGRLWDISEQLTGVSFDSLTPVP